MMYLVIGVHSFRHNLEFFVKRFHIHILTLFAGHDYRVLVIGNDLFSLYGSVNVKFEVDQRLGRSGRVGAERWTAWGDLAEAAGSSPKFGLDPRNLTLHRRRYPE
jgi:hypothetical protein